MGCFGRWTNGGEGAGYPQVTRHHLHPGSSHTRKCRQSLSCFGPKKMSETITNMLSEVFQGCFKALSKSWHCQNFKFCTSDIRNQASNFRYKTSDIGYRISDMRNQTPGTIHHMFLFILSLFVFILTFQGVSMSNPLKTLSQDLP